METLDHKEDFIKSLATLTGISEQVLIEYNQDFNILNILEHPNIINADEKQLEKIRLLNQFYSSYQILQLHVENSKSQMKDPDQAGKYFLSLMSTMKDKERFMAMFLDNGSNIIETRVVSEGSVDSVAVYPREVLKQALACDCKSIIFAHNHPGGSRMFSKEDIELTKRMLDVFTPLGISVHDHFIVANYSYTSMVQAGKMPVSSLDQTIYQGVHFRSVDDVIRDFKKQDIETVDFVKHNEAEIIIATREPLGKFVELGSSKKTIGWVAIDNSRGDAFTENYSSLEEACRFLLGHEAFEMAQPVIEKQAENYMSSMGLSRSDASFTEWFAEKIVLVSQVEARILIENSFVEVYGVNQQEHESLMESLDELEDFENFVVEKESIQELRQHSRFLLENGMQVLVCKVIADYCIKEVQDATDFGSAVPFDEIEVAFDIELKKICKHSIEEAIAQRIETAAIEQSDEGFYLTLYTNYFYGNEDQNEDEMEM